MIFFWTYKNMIFCNFVPQNKLLPLADKYWIYVKSVSCISETCRYAQCVKKLMRSAMYLSSYHDICDIYHQNSMTEINSFDIYSWHKHSVYDTCQEIILPTTWKKSPSGWMTPEIILLNDLKTPQKWSLAFPRPLNRSSEFLGIN